MTRTLLGAFADRTAADRAIADLTAAGFTARLANASQSSADYAQDQTYQSGTLVEVDPQERESEAQQILLRDGAMLRSDTPLASDANSAIGGVTPAAVTDAPLQSDASAATTDGEDAIGGVAPSAVSNTPQQVAASHSGDDLLIRQSPTAPADSTIVSPGMETPYTVRQAESGLPQEGHPVTDEEIIAEEQRRREHGADLDVPPAPDEPSAAPQSGE